MTLKIKITLVLAVLVSTLGAQTQIYRSLQYNKTTAIKVGTGINLTISGSTATFASAMPDSIGVGDAIEYDKDDGGVVDAICFIHGRTSSTVFTVKTATGADPIATSAADQNWSIFRAYTSFLNWQAVTENTGITAGVRNFDAVKRDLVANNEVWNIACYRSSNDDAAIFIGDGWVTDSTRYVRTYTPYSTSEVGTTQRHNGTETQPYFRMNSMVALTDAGTDKVKCFRFEGLVWRMEGTNCANVQISDALANSRIFFDDIVFYGRDGSGCSGTTAGITAGTDFNGRVFVRNCIFYKFDGGGNNSGVGRHSAIYYASSAASTGTIYVNNCTDYNSNYFIDHEEPQGFVTVKNSLTQTGDNSTAFFTAGGASFTAASDYNLSDKAADAPGANSKNSTSVTFVSTAANNYHLNSGDAGAGNSGTSLASDYLPVTTDIDSEARPVTLVDMGADEGVAAPTEMDMAVADGDATPSTSDSTDFGTVNLGQTLSVTYTITNSGGTTLTLSGTPKVAVSGTHSSDFTVTTQPSSPVSANGGTTTFVVKFTPSATGVRSATLSIANDDSNENPYNFSIQGSGSASQTQTVSKRKYFLRRNR